ncbi:hypothetical protein MTO96_028282 [Rhipicephalus appendiculatus]
MCGKEDDSLPEKQKEKEESTKECESLKWALQEEQKQREILRDEIAALRLAFQGDDCVPFRDGPLRYIGGTSGRRHGLARG